MKTDRQVVERTEKEAYWQPHISSWKDSILACTSLPSTRITQWLDNIATWRGYPKKIRVDNEPENISSHCQKWAKENSIKVVYIQPGKSAQNG